MLDLDAVNEESDLALTAAKEDLLRAQEETRRWQDEAGRLRDELEAMKNKEILVVQEEIQQDFSKQGEQLYLTETKFNEPEPQHVTIDHDEKGGNAKNLEEKYHLIKKKLKKQKEVAESQEGEIEDLK